jgi:hypothetical protein
MTEPVKTPATPPTKPEEPKTVVEVPLTEEQKKKAEILLKIQKVLGQYNGEESNIPITSNYWNLLNEYRAKSN